MYIHLLGCTQCMASLSCTWKGGGRRGVSLFQGEQRVISPPTPPPPAGCGPPAHCPAGVVNLQQNGEGNGMWHCRAPIQYPTRPNHQQPQHPPTHPHRQGSGSTPDLSHSGLGCGDGTVVLLFGLTSLRSFSERVLDDISLIICSAPNR